jgi:hypothetical protein
MTASNTAKGELRKISQRSSRVCCLLEGRKDKSRFDYDSILPLYNRNALYSRATTSQDNRTHDLALQASIAFIWNHELFTLKPAKERVVSLLFKDTDLTDATSKAWKELEKFSPEQLAAIGDFVLRNQKGLTGNIIETCKTYANNLRRDGVLTARIAENHAIVLAGAAVFLTSLGLSNEIEGVYKYTVECAKKKLETAKTDAHDADYFFEAIEDVGPFNGVVRTDAALIVHLAKVLPHLQKNGHSFPNKTNLINELKTHERYKATKTTRLFGGSCRAYFFTRVAK